MEFPLKSLGAFGAAFGAASLFCDWLRAYVLGWTETKWTPQVNFGIDVIAALVFFVPAALLGFARSVSRKHGTGPVGTCDR
jgi:hypothetical protein